jgi:uncharacterized coiled-coil protein SlyX
MRRFPRLAALAILASAFALLGLACLSGCATRHARPRYSPPSVTPVRETVGAAQKHVVAATTSAKAAAGAIRRAEASAARIFRAAAPDLRPEIERLKLALAHARTEIDALTAQLLESSKALDVSQARITELETRVAAQTSALNTAVDDKNAALDRANTLDRQRRAALAQRNSIMAILTCVIIGGALILFRRPLGAMLGIPIP